MSAPSLFRFPVRSGDDSAVYLTGAESAESLTVLSTAEASRVVLERPLFVSAVQAGFPSPAEDYVEDRLDLNERLIRNPASTYFVRVSGDSMAPAVPDGALLVVDCALAPVSGRVVVAVVDGEMTVKRLRQTPGRLALTAENPDYPAIEILPGRDFEVFGVVVAVINEKP